MTQKMTPKSSKNPQNRPQNRQNRPQKPVSNKRPLWVKFLPPPLYRGTPPDLIIMMALKYWGPKMGAQKWGPKWGSFPGPILGLNFISGIILGILLRSNCISIQRSSVILEYKASKTPSHLLKDRNYTIHKYIMDSTNARPGRG